MEKVAEVEQFSSLIEVMGIEPPEKGVKERWHVSVVGFGVRIAAPTKAGKVRRSYIARCEVLKPDGTYKDDKPTLGLVVDIGTGDLVLSYKDAENKARDQVEAAKRRKAGGTVRLTMGDTWALLDKELATGQHDSPTYVLKIRSIYDRFLSHLAKRYLDELYEGFWSTYLAELRAGTLRVGTDDAGKPVLRHAKSASYALAIFNVIGRLYGVGHDHRGIEGQADTWDPTRKAVKKIEEPDEREGIVKFEDLAKAWHAVDQLVSPWWRDLWRTYLLSGLRDMLVMEMRWERLDLDKGIYLISPLQQGAKRRRGKLTAKDRDTFIEMPLSSYVCTMLKRRKQFAPQGNPWVWYSPEAIEAPPKKLTPKQQEAEAARIAAGKEKRKPAERLTDPRASWKRLIPVLNYWVYKHDLRRTYASLGATIDKTSTLALSLLLLHSNKTVADALKTPVITVKYIKAQQYAMKMTTERITQGVLELVGEKPRTELTASLSEYLELPFHISDELEREERMVEVVGPVFEEGESANEYEMQAA